MRHILSIQSHVATGHAGNSAAVFILQRLGNQVTHVNTVNFSNHTGHGKWKGRVNTPEEIQAIIDGVAEVQPLGSHDALLTGYMGSVELGEVVLQTIDRMKSENPGALYCCDTVLADVGRGIFVRDSRLVEFFRTQAIQKADIITPNEYELELLAGRAVNSLEDIKAACAQLHQKGPKIILVTSVTVDSEEDTVSMIVSENGKLWKITTPKFAFPKAPVGSGDVTASIFLSKYLETKNVEEALEFTANAIYAVFAETHRKNEYELEIVAAQDQIANPTINYRATELKSAGDAAHLTTTFVTDPDAAAGASLADTSPKKVQ